MASIMLSADGMDWDGNCSESELSSCGTYSSDGFDGDDELSDWFEAKNIEGAVNPSPSQALPKQQRFMK
ncbi:unnamed protein product [Gongylonema pulchrum]|uniref:Uncharacterized protein n=1 Tax=Gongylonema pulchrum TaxID=637853 RepID=A0A183EWI9_9BILA|nr:unnamed protein product [Gongylonema pulchrum]